MGASREVWGCFQCPQWRDTELRPPVRGGRDSSHSGGQRHWPEISASVPFRAGVTAAACRANWKNYHSVACPWWASLWASCPPASRRRAARWLARTPSSGRATSAEVCRTGWVGWGTGCGSTLPGHTEISLVSFRCEPRLRVHTHLEERERKIIHLESFIESNACKLNSQCKLEQKEYWMNVFKNAF